MRKTFLGALGFLLVSPQMQAQTEMDSIGSTHELKDVVVKATNGIKSRFRVDNTEIVGQGQLICQNFSRHIGSDHAATDALPELRAENQGQHPFCEGHKENRHLG